MNHSTGSLFKTLTHLHYFNSNTIRCRGRQIFSKPLIRHPSSLHRLINTSKFSEHLGSRLYSAILQPSCSSLVSIKCSQLASNGLNQLGLPICRHVNKIATGSDLKRFYSSSNDNRSLGPDQGPNHLKPEDAPKPPEFVVGDQPTQDKNDPSQPWGNADPNHSTLPFKFNAQESSTDFLGLGSLGFDPISAPTQEEAPSPMFKILKLAYTVLAYLLSASAIYFLYLQVYKNHQYTAMLAVAPSLFRFIPLFDLGQINRAWLLTPIALGFGLLGYFRGKPPKHIKHSLSVLGLMMLSFCNYRILSNFDYFSWPAWILSLFGFSNWFVYWQLSVVAPDISEVPLEQRSYSELLHAVSTKLNQLEADEEKKQASPWLTKAMLCIRHKFL